MRTPSADTIDIAFFICVSVSFSAGANGGEMCANMRQNESKPFPHAAIFSGIMLGVETVPHYLSVNRVETHDTRTTRSSAMARTTDEVIRRAVDDDVDEVVGK